MQKLDRRVVRTRQLLQDALIELILEQGYDSVRIEDITERANLGRATFYAHYRDREDLLFATIESTRRELKQRIAGCDSPGLIPGFREQFEHAAENEAIYRAVLNHVGGLRRLRNVMVEVVGAHLQQIVPDPPMPLEAVANFLAGALLQWLDWWLESGQRYSIEEMESMFYRLITLGLPGALDVPQPFAEIWTRVGKEVSLQAAT